MLIQKDIQQQIADIETKWQKLKKTGELTTGMNKRMGTQTKFLKTCLHFLRVDPREEFVNKQRGQVTETIKRIVGGYEAWCKAIPGRKIQDPACKKLYYKELELSKHKRHLKTLSFILGMK